MLYVGEPYLMRLEEQEAHYISLRDELRAARKAGKAVGKPLPSSKKSDNLSASLNNSGILSASLTSKQSSSVAQAKPSKSANAPKDTTSIAISVPSTKNAVHAPSFVAPTQDENERGNVSIVYASEADGEYEDDDLTLYTSATEVRATSSICTVRRETPL